MWKDFSGGEQSLIAAMLLAFIIGVISVGIAIYTPQDRTPKQKKADWLCQAEGYVGAKAYHFIEPSNKEMIASNTHRIVIECERG